MRRKHGVPISRLGRWFNDFDFETEVEIIKDIVENDLAFQIFHYPIDHRFTDFDEVYGETDTADVKFKAPNEFFVIPTLQPAENKAYDNQSKIRYEEHGIFEFQILLKELEEKNSQIHYGDVVGFPEDNEQLKYFQIVDDGKIHFDNQKQLYGYKPYYRTIRSVVIDINQFSGK